MISLDNASAGPLEEGFIREDDEIVATRTGRYDISVRDGKIDQLSPADQGDSTLPSWDAQDALLLPATQDMHIHLDKTFYGGPWQVPRSRQGKTIMDMIAREQVLIPQLLPHSQVEELMREAMQHSVEYVGGLDPTNVEGAMETSLDAMFKIALDYQRGGDIHLHETSPAGVAAIQYMIDTVAKNPVLKGKVTLSHGFALATLTSSALDKMIDGLAEQQLSVASTQTIGKLTMPIPQ